MDEKKTTTIYEHIDSHNLADAISDMRRLGFRWALIKIGKVTRELDDGSLETTYRYVATAWPPDNEDQEPGHVEPTLDDDPGADAA